MPENSKLDKSLFLILSILMGVVIIISNYLVQFPINKFNLQEILTYGAFSYPITFLITDLANRRFGKEKARRLVYFGIFWFYSRSFINVICLNKFSRCYIS